MADVADAALEFADLAKNLKLVGLDGLRRELYKALDEAAAPLAHEIGNVDHLKDYMPARYAGVLAGDLRIVTHKRAAGTDPGVILHITAPTLGRGGRKVRQRNTGLITHPLFGNKQRWFTQFKGMRPGFADDPAERAGPVVRDRILEAVRRAADMAVGK